MRFTLKEYQTEAVEKILKTLGYARSDWHARKRRTAFALSSTTGSGKTVIAATVIEALLHGSDEFDVEADRSAVVLWVSKDPSLNVQTRSRFIQCADRIPSGDLVLLNKNYAEDSLQTGTVYFINPDKLGKNADFVKHTDTRKVTFWEILANTIEDEDKTLYMVLDEAHEGMKAPSNSEQTIVQKIMNGNGANPAMPIVWGISATVKRFNDAMAKADAFAKEPNVTIDPKDVQDSGLLKNALMLDIPDEDGDFSTTMIRDATLDFVDVCERWEAYCDREAIDPVVPLLVAQIPNKTDGEKDTEKGRKEEDEIIHLVLETIRKHWPDMPEECIAHVLGDRATINVGAYEIPRVAPQDVERDHRIRVLLAKDAVSTGWDCPRAEVLVSLRPGRDETYVTQLLGRMVRTPLAQNTSEERLNSATCYLPNFDKDTAKLVAEEIMGLREPRSGQRGASVAKVLLKPVTLTRNREVPDKVFKLVEGLPSLAKPAAAPRPIKRILKAAQALAQDELVPEANKTAHEAMFAVLDSLIDAHREAIDAQAKNILTADVRRIIAERGSEESTAYTTQRAADAATVDDALRHLRRLITVSVVNSYLSRNMQAAINDAYELGEDPSLVDITAIRAEVAALGLVDVQVKERVEDAADSLTRLWLGTKAKDIAKLPDSRKPTYEAIQEMARQPELITIEIKTTEQVDTVDTSRKLLPTAKKHLLSDSNGDYPLDIKLNRWERATIAQEIPNCIAWYRNPSAAGKNSLRIAHKTGETWKSIQPDLIFISADNRPSIIDPHGSHLSDAAPKLKALAEYADEYGDHFARIIAVGVEKDNVLYGLDLKNPKTRRAVYESPADSESLRTLYERRGTKYAEITESD
ncbi:DEAD/DEAH box helicase [Nocardia otitidiscaviarum]|uniref:DEAD/DEAH box helicase n=1 Tax=Nocardia otitidiscaviarum TaxID=1823 RepID=UPI001893DF20|nr:DEAD/DEAH box helicase family protein [Nocardia otitidiscaviarum]MBF6177507.1 DEAD/DEAH box helicase family protein [Nocardia otitidiscaviarum]